MPKEADRSEHRAMGWAAIGGTLAAIGAPTGAGLAFWGATSHLWGDDYLLAGFAAACLLTALGLYALIAEFIGGIGPLKFPLPPTRHEREAKRRQPSKPLRVFKSPPDRIPPVTAPLIQVDEQELRSIAASEEKRAHARAEAQLAAAIRSGNCLWDRGHGQSPLGLQWYAQTETLVKTMVGELEASRLNHRRGLESWLAYLDDLASQVAATGRQLTPSDAWDSYVERMQGFRQDVEVDQREGEQIRAELFGEDKFDVDRATAMVTSWLGSVEGSFESVPKLREMLRSPYVAGMSAGYEGLSEEESRIVWRLDRRLSELGPLLAVVAPYVQAVKGE